MYFQIDENQNLHLKATLSKLTFCTLFPLNRFVISPFLYILYGPLFSTLSSDHFSYNLISCIFFVTSVHKLALLTAYSKIIRMLDSFSTDSTKSLDCEVIVNHCHYPKVRGVLKLKR